jgi:transcriptional regulator GlxA family with amidase domain
MPSASTPRSPIHVSVVVFPECDPSIVYGVFDTLWAAGRVWEQLNGRGPGNPYFEPRLVAAEPGPLTLVTGVTIVPHHAVSEVGATDIVCVPNVMIDSPKTLRGLDARLLRWIARRYDDGAHVYSACGGSLVLAAAGLLDGRETTTHWAYVPLFRSQFPNVQVRADRLLVQSGAGDRIVCCGGASSWQDLTMFMVAKHVAPQEAMRLSKVFLYQWHRDGQLPYACFMQNAEHDDGVIHAQQEWLADNYHRADVLALLVERSRLPKRTFDRRFKRATGYAPLSYVQALRIEEAKQFLETTNLAIEVIAPKVGYQDLASFRRLFARLTGLAPGAYRRKFQMPRSIERAVQGEALVPSEAAAPPAAVRPET